MLTKIEAQQIAAAANALRPDWSQAQIMGVLADERIRARRSYADTAIAFTALATDANSRQPTRIFEHGHWWEILAPRVTASYRTIEDDDCAICYRPKALHSRLSMVDGHDYEPQHARATSTGLSDEQRAVIEAARVEAEDAKTAEREPEEEPTHRTADQVLAERQESA